MFTRKRMWSLWHVQIIREANGTAWMDCEHLFDVSGPFYKVYQIFRTKLRFAHFWLTVIGKRTEFSKRMKICHTFYVTIASPQLLYAAFSFIFLWITPECNFYTSFHLDTAITIYETVKLFYKVFQKIVTVEKGIKILKKVEYIHTIVIYFKKQTLWLRKFWAAKPMKKMIVVLKI